MEIFYIIIGFIYGSIFGSLAGVLLERIPKNEDYVKCSSHCVSCGNNLKFYHNIPIFSWLWLRGKCAYCDKKIPVKLFLIEFATGLYFSLIVWYFEGRFYNILAGFIFYFLCIFFISKLLKKRFPLEKE